MFFFQSQRLKHEDEDLDLEIERDDRYNDSEYCNRHKLRQLPD